MREGIKSKDEGMYYFICPDNSQMFRSVQIWFNPWTGTQQARVSNPVIGVPPPELKPISPLKVQRLMRNGMASSYA